MTPLTEAEMVELPEEIACAAPTEDTVATEVVDEVQVTWRVISRADPSLKVPVALKFWLVAGAMEALDGVSAIETRVALLTVREAVPTWPEKTAEIVVAPG